MLSTFAHEAGRSCWNCLKNSAPQVEAWPESAQRLATLAVVGLG
jgi:hypothetical protein